MARPLRIEFPGALYHVTSRGNGGDATYVDDEDRKQWLVVLDHVCERFNWAVHAYCQMGNHYHLLVETPDGNLGQGMRQMNGVYTQRFNRRHGRSGHVFQGRYKSILVQKDAYLLELSRYIVLNPVRARMVRSAKDWPWSSYRATAGIRAAPKRLETDRILAALAKRKREAQSAYRRFVAEGKNQPSPWGALKNQVYLGSASFVEEMQGHLKKDQSLSEVPKTQRRPVAKALRSYFADGTDRDAAILQAFRSGNYSMREIGDHLGLHYSRISRIIRNGSKARNKT